MLESISIVVLISFLCRCLSVMISYAFHYGQLLDFLKILVAKRINHDLTKEYIYSIQSQSHGDEIMQALYDILCSKKGSWAFLLRMMDCTYCLSMWVSIIPTILGVIYLGLIGFLIPIFTFFFVEKL